MWTVEELTGYSHGSHYIVKNEHSGGYVADNSSSGGALHFLVKSDAETLAQFLSTTPLG